MTLTVLVRDSPEHPSFTLTNVQSIRSDGKYLRVENLQPVPPDIVLYCWPMLLSDVAEVQLSEP